jgi:thiol:disulfide interchange protein/DsbC/DsbD-like thiol-disulfide interchange protein
VIPFGHLQASLTRYKANPMARTFLAFFLAVFAYAFPALGQVDSSNRVTARLIADSGAFSPGKPILLGVHIQMAPGWHTYWLNPGDSGLPTVIDLKLPPRWKAEPVQWPIPSKFVEPGDLTTFGYKNEVLLTIRLTPPEDLSPGDVTLQARTSWLACESTCIPGSADIEITLPVANGAQSTHQELFAKFKALLPVETPPPFKVHWEPHDTEFHLKVSGLPPGTKAEFFPFDPGVAPITLISPGFFRIPTPKAEPTASPAPVPSITGVLVTTSADGLERKGWRLQFSPPPRGQSRSAAVIQPKVEPTLPPEATQPAPIPKVVAELTLPVALGYGFLGGIILNLMPCVLPVIALKLLGFLGQAGQSRQKVLKIGLVFSAGIFFWFFLIAGLVTLAKSIGHEVNWAFQFQNPLIVGGMCIIVFVFALNLLGVFEIWLPGSGRLASLAQREGYLGTFLHGVFATLLATPCTAPFLGPALAFAFSQNAPTTFAMFTAVAAGMSTPYLLLSWQPGWMRFLPKPGDWMVHLKQAMGFLLFGTVIWLLTVLASQGGKPLLATMLWVLLGIGLSCWIVGGMHSFSAQGGWMRLSKGVIGFLMVGFAIWLLAPLPVPKLTAMLWLLLGIKISSWIGQTWLTPPLKIPQRIVAISAIVLILYGAYKLGETKDPSQKIAWEPWSSAAVQAAQAEGKPVFIDFTADWCVNCKVNEKFVLETPEVRNALKAFTTLKADWTKGDPLITAELKRLKRAGVPVYAVYSPTSETPEILPELLTKEIVLKALKQAKP